MMTNDKRRNMLMYVLTVIIITLMVGASELVNEKEIIFPEIAAIAIGSLLAPKYAWRTSKIRILLSIFVCAILGVGIVRFLPLSSWGQINLAFGLAQILCVLSQTTFVPMISAIVLPVLLQTNSPVYIVAAVCLTSLILLVQILLERLHIRKQYTYVKQPIEKESIFLILVRTSLVLIISAVALRFGFKFCIAPPLLVAFTEFTDKDSKAVSSPAKAILLITGCALSGAVCRLVCTMYLRLPVTVAAIFAIMIALFLLQKCKMFIPPAGAMTILAMLIPDSAVMGYACQVFIGVSIYMTIAVGMRYIRVSKKESIHTIQY